MLVDSHCHLHMLELGPEGDAGPFLRAGAEVGVEHFLTVAVNAASVPAVLGFAKRFDNVSAAVGVHPSEQDEDEPTVAGLLAMAAAPGVVAIGETGLDYHYNKGDLDWQRRRFRTHIAAARETGKPLIVHTRDAREDTVNLLREERAGEAGGVIHCFTEDLDTAERCLELGFYISFSGIITFRNAEALREVVRRVPLERILVETDAPYLAPVPHRGKPNQPAYVRHVAEKVAEIKELSLDEVAAATSANFYRLFREARRAA